MSNPSCNSTGNILSAPGDLYPLNENIASRIVEIVMNCRKLSSQLGSLVAGGSVSSSNCDGECLSNSSSSVSLGPLVNVLSSFLIVQLPL